MHVYCVESFAHIECYILSSEVLMKSIEAEILRPDALPGVNHMRGMQYKIALNMAFWSDSII